MATSAVARETVFALRRQIAKIEGTLPERFEAPAGTQSGADVTVVRRDGVVDRKALLSIGAQRFDGILGGGLPKAALTEIHGAQTRDAGAAAGFALSLVSLLLRQTARPLPVLWIGTSEIFHEAGFPYAAGLHALFGIEPETLLFVQAPKLDDALWVAEEAARLTALSAVILEIRGNPERLGLTATRRLHRRAQDAGRPVFLMRQAAEAEPTAAPVRLVVSPAPAAARHTIAGPLRGTIGRPAFTVSVGKSRTALPGQFTLEWNCDERAFEDRHEPARQPKNPFPVVSLSADRADPAAAAGQVLAFKASEPHASGHKPPREQRPAHRRPRRAG